MQQFPRRPLESKYISKKLKKKILFSKRQNVLKVKLVIWPYNFVYPTWITMFKCLSLYLWLIRLHLEISKSNNCFFSMLYLAQKFDQRSKSVSVFRLLLDVCFRLPVVNRFSYSIDEFCLCVLFNLIS